MCIYIPIWENVHIWVSPDECVWNAVQEMQMKYALSLLYELLFHKDDVDSSYSTRFFTATLGIPDCTWVDYVDELKWVNVDDCDDSDMITNIYTVLDVLCLTMIASEKSDLK